MFLLHCLLFCPGAAPPPSWLAAPPPPCLPLPLIRRVNWPAAPLVLGRWVGGGRGERGGDELSLGSHLALSCYFWGVALSPLLDGGKSMATLWPGGKHGVGPNTSIGFYSIFQVACIYTYSILSANTMALSP